LRARGEPFNACERLNAALRTGKVRLWVDETVVPPEFFEGALHVWAEVAPDGRCTGMMAERRAVERQSEWTMSGDDVDALLALESAPKQRSGGRPPLDWDRVLAVIIEVIHTEGPPPHSGNAAFAKRVCDRCSELGMEPHKIPDPETVRHKLPTLLAHVRPGS
jgi:hypothetical protein